MDTDERSLTSEVVSEYHLRPRGVIVAVLQLEMHDDHSPHYRVF